MTSNLPQIKNIYSSDYFVIIHFASNNFIPQEKLLIIGNKKLFFPKSAVEHQHIYAELKISFTIKDVIVSNETVLFISTDGDLWVIGETPMMMVISGLPVSFFNLTKLKTPKIKEFYYEGNNSLILDINDQIWIIASEIKNTDIYKVFIPELKYDTNRIFRYTLTTLNQSKNFSSIKNGLMDVNGSPWNIFQGEYRSGLNYITEIIKSSYGQVYFQPFTIALRNNIILIPYEHYERMKSGQYFVSEKYSGEYEQHIYNQDIRNIYAQDHSGIIYEIKVIHSLDTNIISRFAENEISFSEIRL